MKNSFGLPLLEVAVFAAAITGFALGAIPGAILAANIPPLSDVGAVLVLLGGAFGGIFSLSAILRVLERLTF